MKSTWTLIGIVGIMAYFVYGLTPGIIAVEKRTREPRIVTAMVPK